MTENSLCLGLLRGRASSHALFNKIALQKSCCPYNNKSNIFKRNDSQLGSIWDKLYPLFCPDLTNDIFMAPQGKGVLFLSASVHPSVCWSDLLCMITPQWFQLESPKLHQTCILGYCQMFYLRRSSYMTCSVCPSVCPSVRHTFFPMFPSSYHHEIFWSYYQWQKWRPRKRSRSEVKGQGHRSQHPT